MFPNYPQRPNIPNPYQIVGQAVGDFAGNVQTFGREQDALQERFRQMMEKRAQAELAAKQRQEDLAFKQAEEERNSQKFQAEQEGLQKAAKVRGSIAERLNSGKPLTRQEEIDLYMAEGLDVPKAFATPEPRKPERVNANGGVYEIGPDGGIKTLIPPKPSAPPKEPRGQVVETADGSLAIVDPVSGTSRPVTGGDGQPVKKRTPGQLTGKQLENAQGKARTLAVAKSQLKNLRDSWNKIKDTPSAGPEANVVGRGWMSPTGDSFDAAVEALYTTVRQLTRTPGEGAMSDYESRLATAQIPSRMRFEGTTEQQIKQLEDLINTIETGYASAGAPTPVPNPNPGAPGQVGRFKVRVKGN